MNSPHLDNRVAVVTGGGSGIGREIARLLARAGAHVVAADLNEDGARETVAAFGSERTLAAHVDIRDRASIKTLMALAAEWGGRLDILVNSAGIVRNWPADGLSDDDWAAVLDVNLSGTWRCCQAAFPYLCRHGGAIVNLSSIAGLTARPYGGAYGPSKAGIVSITGMLAAEWGRYRIRVNAVAPGFIETPMTLAALQKPGERESAAKKVPLGRLGQPNDPAQLVLFLVSSAADYISGQTIAVDGGVMATLLWGLTGDVAGLDRRGD